MFNIEICYKDTPVLHWCPQTETFQVWDSQLVPDVIYDHLWAHNSAETNPASRVKHNRRVVSNWIASVSNIVADKINSYLSVIPKDPGMLKDLLSCTMQTPWVIQATNEPARDNSVNY